MLPVPKIKIEMTGHYEPPKKPVEQKPKEIQNGK
jgi:hypothetical protein